MLPRRDEHRIMEMEGFGLGPNEENRRDKRKRRSQNRLAQRSFRARSKIQNQEVSIIRPSTAFYHSTDKAQAINQMQHLEALAEAQQSRPTCIQEIMEKLQRENASLMTERCQITEKVLAPGVQGHEGLGCFNVRTFG